MTTRNPGTQSGASLISWLFIISIGLFFVLLGVRMVPVYMEHFALERVLENVSADRKMEKATAGEIKKNIIQRLKINSVYNFDPKNITIKKAKSGREIVVDYEVRRSVIGNVFVVMVFNASGHLQQPRF